MIKIAIMFLIFISGFVFFYNHTPKKEGFDISMDCPNLLIQKGKKLHLIYKNKARVPGVNPLVFENLEEYVEFIEWQRTRGIRCPILYFDQTFDTQGNIGYRMLPDPVDKNGGLSSHIPPPSKMPPVKPLYDANHDDPPFNKNSNAGFDPEDQYVGAYTYLDRNFDSQEKPSINAMDTGWGGVAYSRKKVESLNLDKQHEQCANDLNSGDDATRTSINTYFDKKKQAEKLEQKISAEIASRYGGKTENTPVNRTLG